MHNGPNIYYRWRKIKIAMGYLIKSGVRAPLQIKTVHDNITITAHHETDIQHCYGCTHIHRPKPNRHKTQVQWLTIQINKQKEALLAS